MLALFCTLAFCIVFIVVIIKQYKEYIVNTKLFITTLCIKILAACLYGWYFSNANYETDTWKFHEQALIEYKWLLQNPWAFLKDLFVHGYNTPQHNTFFDTQQSYWKDLPNNIFVKFLACCNVLTKGHYYYNAIVLNTISMVGVLYGIKSLQIIVPNASIVFKYVVFFVPPILFFSSGIHKDACIFWTSIILVYSTLTYLKYKKAQHIILFFAAFIYLLVTKNMLAISFAACIPMFIFFSNKKVYKPIIVLLQIAILITCLAITYLLPNAFNLVEKITQKQNSFLQLQGATPTTTVALQTSLKSYMQYAGIAVQTAFLEPNLFSAKGFYQQSIAMYNIMCILFFIAAIIHIKKTAATIHPIWMLLLPFIAVNYLLIGYTVTFSGAVIRYRIVIDVWVWIFCLAALQQYLQKKLLV